MEGDQWTDMETRTDHKVQMGKAVSRSNAEMARELYDIASDIDNRGQYRNHPRAVTLREAADALLAAEGRIALADRLAEAASELVVPLLALVVERATLDRYVTPEIGSEIRRLVPEVSAAIAAYREDAR